MNAIDTNVLVYEVDAGEPVKRARARSLLRRLAAGSTPTILPWQVVVEFVSVMRRWEGLGLLSSADPRAYAQRILGLFPLDMPVPSLLDRCFDLATRHSLSHYDAMLLAACVEAGVTTLYSEDLTDGATYDTVTVVNPFA